MTAYTPFNELSLIPWNVVSINTNLAVNNGYIASSGGNIDLILPPSANIGETLRITNLAGGFTIKQNALQSINFGVDFTTPGITGEISTNNDGDSIELICVASGAATTYQVLSSIGNFTIV